MLKYDFNEIQKLCKNYCKVGQVLGQGTFGVVFKATLNKNQKYVALKCINKETLLYQEKDSQISFEKNQLIHDEVSIMTNCNNINIIKCFRVLQNTKYLVLVLQYCEGGDLFHQIMKQGRIKETLAIKILAQIITGFASLHKMKIIHRDFKSDNVLNRKGVYKIADFGTAKKMQQLLSSNRGTLVGSRITMSPQVIQGKQYGIQSDMWSLGIVYFEILFGLLPFKNVINDVQINKLWIYLEAQNCSNESKQLLKKMLVIDPNQRLKWIYLYKLYNKRQGVFCSKLFNKQQIITQQSQNQDDFSNINSIAERYQQNQRNQINNNPSTYIHKDNIHNSPNRQSKKQNKPKYKLKQQGFKQVFKQVSYVQKQQLSELAKKIRLTRIRSMLLYNIVQLSQVEMNKIDLVMRINIHTLRILINQDAREILCYQQKFLYMSEENINLYYNQKQEILGYQKAAKLIINQFNTLIKDYSQTLFQYQIKAGRDRNIALERKERASQQSKNINNILTFQYHFSYINKKNWIQQYYPNYLYIQIIQILREQNYPVEFNKQMNYQMKQYLKYLIYWRDYRKFIEDSARYYNLI